MAITISVSNPKILPGNVKKQIEARKIRTGMEDDVGDFVHLPVLGFGGLGKTVVAALLAGVAMLFFTSNARAQIGWTDTTTSTDTSVVITGDAATTGTGTDITAVEGDGTMLTVTLTTDSSVGSTSGTVIIDGTGISNPGSGTDDTTTTVVLDSGSSVTVEDNGSGAVGVSLDGGSTISTSGAIDTTATGTDFTAGIEDVISAPASSTSTIEVTNEPDGTITVTGGSGGTEGIDVSNTDGSTTGLVVATNDGTITVEGTGGGFDEGISAENTGTGSVTVSDSGTITVTGTSGTSAEGINAETSGTGDTTVTLADGATLDITSTGGTSAEGVNALSNSTGTVNVTDSGAITITGDSVTNTEGINAENTGTGGLTVTVGDTGTIDITANGDASADGINASADSTSAVLIIDQGTITVEGTNVTTTEGVVAENSGTGGTTVTVEGTATIDVTGTGGTTTEGITASGDSAGTVAVMDNGTIMVESTSVTTTEGISAENTGTGEVTVTDTGAIAITANGGTSAEGINILETSTGTVTVADSGTIAVTGTNGTSADGILADNTGTGGITITESGTVVIQGDGGTTTGIDATTVSGTIGITNSGTINVGNTNGGVDGILATTTTGSIEITDSGAINALGGTAIAAGGSASTPISITLTGAAAIQGSINGNINAVNPTGSILHLDLAGISPTEANAASAYLAANPNGGSLVINGVTYTYLNFNSVTSNFLSFSTIPGFGSMGNALDSLNHTSTQVQTLINALAAVPNGSLPQALSELSPAKAFQQLATSTFQNALFENAKLDSHLENIHESLGGGGIDWSGLSIASADEPLFGSLLAYNPASPAQRTVSDTPAHQLTSAQQFNRWGGFLSGNAVLADQDATGNFPPQNSTTVDVTAGVDYRVDRNWTVGFLFGYGNTSADLDNLGSKTNINTYRFGPYASYDQGSWFVNGHAEFGFNQQSINRNIPFLGTSAHSNPDGDQYGAGFDGGYEFHSGRFTYGPIAGVQYTHLDVNSYSETGAGVANLNIGHAEADSFITSLGGKLECDYHCKWNNSDFRPEISASWQHECLDDSQLIGAAFDVPGSASFTTSTLNPERDSALLGVGVSDIFPSGSLLFVSYFAQAGQSDYFAQSITGGFRLAF
jgi:fibronectin-binding autotransporter adhesin